MSNIMTPFSNIGQQLGGAPMSSAPGQLPSGGGADSDAFMRRISQMSPQQVTAMQSGGAPMSPALPGRPPQPMPQPMPQPGFGMPVGGAPQQPAQPQQPSPQLMQMLGAMSAPMRQGVQQNPAMMQYARLLGLMPGGMGGAQPQRPPGMGANFAPTQEALMGLRRGIQA